MNDDCLIRIKEVCERTALSKSKIYAMVGAGEFPKQTRLSHKVAAWRKSEVVAWIDRAVPAAPRPRDEDLLI